MKPYIVALAFGNREAGQMTCTAILANSEADAVARMTALFLQQTKSELPFAGHHVQEVTREWLLSALDALNGKVPGEARVVSLVPKEAQPGDNGAALPEPRPAVEQVHGFSPDGMNERCTFCGKPVGDPIHGYGQQPLPYRCGYCGTPDPHKHASDCHKGAA